MLMICAHTSESSVTHGICTTIFVQTTWILCNNIICTLLKCDHYGFNNVLSLCRQDGSQLRLALSLMVTGSWPQRRPRRFQLNYINKKCTGMLACLRVRARSLALPYAHTYTYIHTHRYIRTQHTHAHNTHTQAQTLVTPIYSHTHVAHLSYTHTYSTHTPIHTHSLSRTHIHT